MTRRRGILWSLAVVILLLLVVVWSGGSARRPVNPRLASTNVKAKYQFERLEQNRGAQQDLVILAFSGGGTRAAAFSYGVLEALRRIHVNTSTGGKVRLLDEIDVVTGISGGSFTALAFGLKGDKLFDSYEQDFLKRDVQGELVRRAMNPLHWRALMSRGWGMSELAANLYDEILFHGATYADLGRVGTPAIVVGAAELSTGSRLTFTQQNFDVMCADLESFRLARAAAASSAVPVVLSPLTINNYGATCGYQEPDWLLEFENSPTPPRPAGRILKRLQELRELDNAAEDPYFHLVDGAVSDNLGLRGVLDFLETFEALRAAGKVTPLDHVRRILIFVVNSVSTPSTNWNTHESPPGSMAVLTKAAGVPVDRYANESVELLRDIDARWTAMRELRESPAFKGNRDPKAAFVMNAPNADIFVIDVSFQAVKDKAERDYLNELPTSFVLPAAAVDSLRAAAASLVLGSPDLEKALKSAGEEIDNAPGAAAKPAPAAAKP